jgi:hypothetical protein
MTVIHDPQGITTLWHQLRNVPGVVLYVGPDQIMPLTSVLGALVGIALMFWNRLLGLVHKLRARLGHRTETPGKSSAN